MGRRSRSRSRERRRSRSRSVDGKEKRIEKEKVNKSQKDKGSKREPLPVKRRAASPAASSSGDPPAWASNADDAATEEMSLEARVALLEVDNEVLKAENRELRKKLVEALRRHGNAPAASAPVATPREPSPPASVRRQREREAARNREERSPPVMRRVVDEDASKQEDDEPQEFRKNAVMLSNDQMEAYNDGSIPNNIPPETRLPMVNTKLERFLESFDDKIQIIDLKSGGIILKDKQAFSKRYSCVFRESGSKLKGITHKRFYYDAVHRATYVVDFETHESLVTAMPGTPQDGKLGVRPPRTEHLIVMYEETGGKITKMWLRQDAEKLGLDPKAGEETLLRSEAMKAFEAKIAELRVSPGAGPRIFQNYHDTPTVG